MELTRLLLRHPAIECPLLLHRAGDARGVEDLSQVFPALAGNGSHPLVPFSFERLLSGELIHPADEYALGADFGHRL